NGIGEVHFYGEPKFLSARGAESAAIVTNLAEGEVVSKIKDIPEADRAKVAKIVAHDMAKVTQAGLDMSGDIQFVLGRDDQGNPRVQWIDLESIGKPHGIEWEKAYQKGLENFFGKDFLAKHPDLVPDTPQKAIQAGEATAPQVPITDLRFDTDVLDLLTGT